MSSDWCLEKKPIRSRTAPHRDVQRARSLLMACDGLANTRIAAEVGVAPMTVKAWRDRFADDGLKVLLGGAPGARAQAVDRGGEGRGDRAVDAV
jgi:transposase